MSDIFGSRDVYISGFDPDIIYSVYRCASGDHLVEVFACSSENIGDGLIMWSGTFLKCIS